MKEVVSQIAEGFLKGLGFSTALILVFMAAKFLTGY